MTSRAAGVQHDRERGIIALGLGASMLFADAGSETWAAIAFGATLLHVINHAIFKTLLFLGAGAIERAAGSLDLDNLGGLLKRMPWAGGAFLIGTMAIAGPASAQRLFVGVAHPAVSAARRPSRAPGCRARRRGGARRPRRDRRTRAPLLRQGARTHSPWRAAERREPDACDAPAGMRAAMVSLAGMCIALGLLPGLVLPTLAALAPGSGGSTLAVHAGLQIPGTGSYRRSRSRSRSASCRAPSSSRAGAGAQRQRRAGRAGSPSPRSCAGPRRASQSP